MALGVCRNCAGTELAGLGHIGKVAPFFLKRVFGGEIGFAESPGLAKHLVRRLLSLPQGALARMSAPCVYVEMESCRRCGFLQTVVPFDEVAINRLYCDYRSDSYNRERSAYEPSYRRIAAEVGSGEVEIRSRVEAVTKFLRGRVDTAEGEFTMLDYGGADGKFMPRLDAAERFVYEISNIEPIAGVRRIRTEAELRTYSLVQLAHVIEHLVQPLELVRKVATRVAPGGYLYIETPQELTDRQRKRLRVGDRRRFLPIHEHINIYCVQAVTALVEAAGMSLVAIEAAPVDVGWAKAVHIRALGRRI